MALARRGDPVAVRTNWVWLTLGNEQVLAFCYVDSSAGPSARGAAAATPPSAEQVRRAVDRPDRVVREPDRFEPRPILAEEALRLGLPKDPPWIGFFDGRPVPPARGEAMRTVSARVTLRGAPVPNARVRIGDLVRQEFLGIATEHCDENGRCEFPLAPTSEVFAIADAEGVASNPTQVQPDGTVVLKLLGVGSFVGTVARSGIPTAGHITIIARRGGVRCVYGNADGSFQIDDLAPDVYEVRVRGVDPASSMASGPTVFDTIAVEPAVRVHRDYALVAGVPVRVSVAVSDKFQHVHVYLVSGACAPQTSAELRALCSSLGQAAWLMANHTTNDGKWLKTEFADTQPGEYTLCIHPVVRTGPALEQTTSCQSLVVGNESVSVTMHAPELRLHARDAASSVQAEATSTRTKRSARAGEVRDDLDDPDALLDMVLSAEERQLLEAGLVESGGAARPTHELARALEFKELDHWRTEAQALLAALRARAPLSRKGWLQALLTTEVVFSSATLGAGGDWATVTGLSDASTLQVLRGLQHKLVPQVRGLITNGLFGTRPQARQPPPPLPPPMHLFAGPTLSAVLQRSYLVIRRTDESAALFRSELQRVFAIETSGPELKLTGVFLGGPRAGQHQRILRGPPAEVADLAEVLRSRLQPPGLPPRLQATQLSESTAQYDGKVIRVEGVWEHQGEDSTLAGLRLDARHPPGRWLVDVTGAVVASADAGPELRVLELIVLNCLSDDKLRALDEKRELRVGERLLTFQLRYNGSWRVLVDRRPIPMTVKTIETTVSGAGHHYRTESEPTPAQWANLGPALQDKAPWSVASKLQLTLRCEWSTHAECYNTVIYGSRSVKLTLPADMSSVAIEFMEHSDAST
jgi:hypothetical protein